MERLHQNNKVAWYKILEKNWKQSIEIEKNICKLASYKEIVSKRCLQYIQIAKKETPGFKISSFPRKTYKWATSI